MTDALSKQGEMIDEIVFRHYGGDRGYVEQVLDHPKNYRLAEQPEILPLGTKVHLPDAEPPREDVVRLWDD